MRARCIKAFRDLTNGGMRQAGEEFETTAERVAEINGTRYGRLVEVVEDDKAKAVKEAKPEEPESARPEATEAKPKPRRRTPTKRRTPTTKE